jgi:mannose-6-phosphate isomerase-like protein (cupin superfamily)
MATSTGDFQARCVVTEVDPDGRSRVRADGLAATRTVTPTFTVVDLWQADTVPTGIDADSTLGASVAIAPPKTGLLVRIVSFPPDAEWQGGAGYGEAMAAVNGAGTHLDESEIVGLHATDTVDVVTVIEGELCAVLETEEITLRPGDSLVQRGTKHAWSNRATKPATIVATMFSAIR